MSPSTTHTLIVAYWLEYTVYVVNKYLGTGRHSSFKMQTI